MTSCFQLELIEETLDDPERIELVNVVNEGQEKNEGFVLCKDNFGNEEEHARHEENYGENEPNFNGFQVSLEIRLGLDQLD